MSTRISNRGLCSGISLREIASGACALAPPSPMWAVAIPPSPHRPPRPCTCSPGAGQFWESAPASGRATSPTGDWSKPVARFEEAMATIRALWNSGGELVTRDSPFFPLHNAIFALPPYRGKWPEIWIAAHGPRMLRATGRYADAWFPALISRPKDYAAGLEKVRVAASDAGRDPLSITAANWFFVVTGASRGEVDDALGSTAQK